MRVHIYDMGVGSTNKTLNLQECGLTYKKTKGNIGFLLAEPHSLYMYDILFSVKSCAYYLNY